jgi:hypothetical protein
VLHEHVELLEGVRVEEQLDALARRQLAAGMLRRDAGLAAAQPRTVTPLFELLKDVMANVKSRGRLFIKRPAAAESAQSLRAPS